MTRKVPPGAIALAIGGIGWFVHGMYDLFATDATPMSHYADSPLFRIMALVRLLTCVACAWGVVAVSQSVQRRGLAVRVTGVGALTSVILLGGLAFADSFLAPVLATQAPAMLDENPTSGPLFLGMFLVFFVPPLAFAAWGIALAASHEYPRWIGVVIAVGAVGAGVGIVALFGAALVVAALGLARAGAPRQPHVTDGAATAPDLALAETGSAS